MLVHLGQEDPDTRRLVLAQLVSHGVEDPYGYLPREMEGLGRQVKRYAVNCTLAVPVCISDG